MIEINSHQALNNPMPDEETRFIAGLIMDLFSVLFETDNFSDQASLFVICNDKDLQNCEGTWIFEEISSRSFEFVDEITVADSGNRYYLMCIVPSDSFGAYVLIKCNNWNLENLNISRKIVIDRDSTYENFLKSGTPDAI